MRSVNRRPPRTWVRLRAVSPPSRDRHRYVFVVTYGRSGSTLVQGLLNVLPRVLVRGESNFYVLPLFRSLDLVRQFRRIHGSHKIDTPTSAFYGLNAIHRAPFVDALHDIVTRSVLGGSDPGGYDVLGFKEVLWHRIRPEELQEFFEFLEQAFPDSGYVLNTRDLERTLGSGFWQGRTPESAHNSVTRVLAIQDFLRGTRPERCFDTTFEVLTGDDAEARDEMLRGLADFTTGKPLGSDGLAQLRAILEVGHGPFAFGRSRKPE